MERKEVEQIAVNPLGRAIIHYRAAEGELGFMIRICREALNGEVRSGFGQKSSNRMQRYQRQTRLKTPYELRPILPCFDNFLIEGFSIV